jgi:threonine/homoserine/homoserine lactone efflux protein
VLFEIPHLWTIGRNGSPGRATLAEPRRFTTGVLLLWLNPKAWAITLSGAGAFATSVDGPARLAVLLGGAFAVSASLSQLLWCALGGGWPGCCPNRGTGAP